MLITEANNVECHPKSWFWQPSEGLLLFSGAQRSPGKVAPSRKSELFFSHCLAGRKLENDNLLKNHLLNYEILCLAQFYRWTAVISQKLKFGLFNSFPFSLHLLALLITRIFFSCSMILGHNRPSPTTYKFPHFNSKEWLSFSLISVLSPVKVSFYFGEGPWMERFLDVTFLFRNSLVTQITSQKLTLSLHYRA